MTPETINLLTVLPVDSFNTWVVMFVLMAGGMAFYRFLRIITK